MEADELPVLLTAKRHELAAAPAGGSPKSFAPAVWAQDCPTSWRFCPPVEVPLVPETVAVIVVVSRTDVVAVVVSMAVEVIVSVWTDDFAGREPEA
jgi:hypothetical protein